MTQERTPGFRGYIKDIGLFGVVQQILGLRSLILVPLVTKTLGVASYGTITLAYATAGLMIWFVLLSLHSGTVQKLPGDTSPRVISRTFSSMLTVIGLAWVVVMVLTASGGLFMVESLFDDPASTLLLLLIVATLLPDSIKQLMMSWFRIREETNRLLKFEVISTVLEIGTWAVVILSGGGVIQLFEASLIIRSLVAAVILLRFWRAEGFSRPEPQLIVSYLLFCVPLIGVSLASWATALGDRYFLAFYESTVEVGIYSASYSLPRIVVEANAAIWFVLSPVLARLWNSSETVDFDRYYKLAARSIALIVLPLAVLISVLAGPILELLATEQVGESGTYITPLIALGNLMYVLAGYAMYVFLLKSKTYLSTIVALATALSNVLLNLLLVPGLGMIGAAISTVIAYTVMAVLAFALARKLISFTLDWMFIAKVVFASALSGLVVVVLPTGPDLSLLLAGVVGVVVYVLAAVLTGAVSKEERQRLLEAIRSR